MEKVQTPDETPKRSASQLIQVIFNVINHILIVIVTIYMTCLTYLSIKNETDKKLKILHSFFCTIGVSTSNCNGRSLPTFNIRHVMTYFGCL